MPVLQLGSDSREGAAELGERQQPDILERGMCVHEKLRPFELIVSGRDWCNLFKEIRQKQIDLIQERAMKAEDAEKN